MPTLMGFDLGSNISRTIISMFSEILIVDYEQYYF